MSTTPGVSVVMIFLDGERFIDDAIRSVVAQTHADWELVLVDDGSTDGSTAIARAWAAWDGRVRYVEHPGHANLGMSASRNLGIDVARGAFVAFLDCDDIWLPDHLAKQVAILDGDASLDATYDAYRLWTSWTGEHDDVSGDVVSRLGVEPDTVCEPGELLDSYRSDPGTLPAICSVLIRRQALDRIGGFAEEFRGCFEDQVYLAKLGLHLRVHVAGDCTSLYRRHPESACAVAVRDGTYHPARPNTSEKRYLLWLERYLHEHGATDRLAWSCVQEKLVVYRRPLSRPARQALADRVRRAARYRRRRVARAVLSIGGRTT